MLNKFSGTGESSVTLIDKILTSYVIDASLKWKNQEFYFRSFAKIQFRKTAVKKWSLRFENKKISNRFWERYLWSG